MKYVSLILLVLAAGCQTGEPEAKRVIRITGVGWSDPTTYALVPWDPNGSPDSPDNQLLVQKLDEALQRRGFQQVDLSQAEQIIQVRYRSQPDSADGARFAGLAAGQEGTVPLGDAAEPAVTNPRRFHMSMHAFDGPTLRITRTRFIEMWSLTVSVTEANDAGEAIPILAAVARKYLATETGGTIKVTEKVRATSQPGALKNPASS